MVYALSKKSHKLNQNDSCSNIENSPESPGGWSRTFIMTNKEVNQIEWFHNKYLAHLQNLTLNFQTLITDPKLKQMFKKRASHQL